MVFDLNDKDTWLCRKHAANPLPLGEFRPACGPCGGVARHARKQLAAAQEAARAADRAAEEVAAACRARGWCDRDGFVLERRGVRLSPQQVCTHDRDPELILAEVRAAEEEQEQARTGPGPEGPRPPSPAAREMAMAAATPRRRRSAAPQQRGAAE